MEMTELALAGGRPVFLIKLFNIECLTFCAKVAFLRRCGKVQT